jgi:hypothetical protein
MRKLAQFIQGQDVNAFMEKEFNDSMMTLQNLGSLVETLLGNLPIGTYLPSSMSLVAFQKVMGVNWILANGQKVNTDSAFYTQTGQANVVNLVGHVATLNFFVRIN